MASKSRSVGRSRMPRQKVCVIGEPTPANITSVPAIVVRIAPEYGSRRACASMNAALPWPSVVSRRRASGASANTEPIGGANVTPSAPANRRQDCLEHRPHLRQLLDANHEVPRRFELLPAGAVSEMLCGVLERSEEHTSELQSQSNLVCRLLL